MGFLLITLGVIAIILATRLFHRANTPLRPFEKPKNLVTDGIYRFTRNPIYLGMVIILIGLGVFLGGLTTFLVIPIFIWAIQTNFIVLEEQLLLNTFGKEYAEYFRRVRRWI